MASALPHQLLLCSFFLVAACKPAPFVEAEATSGRLARVDDAWILELWGDPEARGRAAGELVGEQIRWLLPRYREVLFGPDGQHESERLPLVKELERGIPEEHRAQLRSLARAARVDYDTLLAVNLSPEIFAPMLCSCFAVRGTKSPDGALRVGRNLDWFGGDLLRNHGLVVVERDPAELSFASLSWPGLVGVVTGINVHGVTAADLVVLRKKQEAVAGVPVLFSLRQVLTTTTSVASAMELLRDTPRTVPQNYLLADAQRAVVLETAPRRFRVREMADDHLEVGNLFDEDQESHPRGRYRQMSSALQAGPADTPTLQALLLKVALGDLNVQAAILEPARRRVLVATERRPAAKGPWRRVDLSPWLGPAPDTPAVTEPPEVTKRYEVERRTAGGLLRVEPRQHQGEEEGDGRREHVVPHR